MSGVDQPSRFRKLLNEIVAEDSGDEKEVALLFSGGVDSTSLGFAAQDIGRKVICYTFQMGEMRSHDSAAAKKIAAAMGWEWNLVKVPVDRIEEDAIKLATILKCKKKTQFECTLPFLYVIPKIKEKVVLSGVAADGHFGLSKRAMIHFRYPRSSFDKFRFDYFANENPAGYVQQKKLVEQHGKKHSAPYMDKRVFDYFIQFGWDRLNTPTQKMPVLVAYKEHFKKVGRRNHANLQLVANVDKICERMLSGKLNTKNRSRMMDLWRDIADRYGNQT